MANEKPDILLMGPAKPVIANGLAPLFNVHGLSEAKDRDAFLGFEYGQSPFGAEDAGDFGQRIGRQSVGSHHRGTHAADQPPSQYPGPGCRNI